MKVIYSLILSLLLISCGPTVFVDYDKETDFTKQQTFQFSEAHTNRFNEPASNNVNSFDAKRIKKAIDNVLTQKQWQRTDYCQFYIDFYKEQFVDDTRTRIGVGAGSGVGGIGVGVGVSIPIGPTMIQERLTIEVYEAYNYGALVWQGDVVASIKENATPEQKETYYQKMVAKILEKFPPNKR